MRELLVLFLHPVVRVPRSGELGFGGERDAGPAAVDAAAGCFHSHAAGGLMLLLMSLWRHVMLYFSLSRAAASQAGIDFMRFKNLKETESMSVAGRSSRSGG